MTEVEETTAKDLLIEVGEDNHSEEAPPIGKRTDKEAMVILEAITEEMTGAVTEETV